MGFFAHLSDLPRYLAQSPKIGTPMTILGLFETLRYI